ncbi:hypothetical protein HK104_002137 [Borealophlyctis nickersoniae]|nr:hypothetical protein HK104_002137 [Borealophlyctis nickersoniae]
MPKVTLPLKVAISARGNTRREIPLSTFNIISSIPTLSDLTLSNVSVQTGYAPPNYTVNLRGIFLYRCIIDMLSLGKLVRQDRDGHLILYATDIQRVRYNVLGRELCPLTTLELQDVNFTAKQVAAMCGGMVDANSSLTKLVLIGDGLVNQNSPTTLARFSHLAHLEFTWNTALTVPDLVPLHTTPALRYLVLRGVPQHLHDQIVAGFNGSRVQVVFTNVTPVREIPGAREERIGTRLVF